MKRKLKRVGELLEKKEINRRLTGIHIVPLVSVDTGSSPITSSSFLDRIHNFPLWQTEGRFCVATLA